MTRRSRTGGGPGSNQYGPRGVSRRRPPRPAAGFSAGVGDGGAATDPLAPATSELDPDEDAHVERIWKGRATGQSRGQLESSLHQLKRRLSDLNAGKVRAAQIVGMGHRDPRRTAREWLERRIASDERDLASRGRTNETNRSNARLAVARQRQGRNLADALRDAPDGHDGAPGGPLAALTAGEVVTYGPTTTHTAAARAAHDAQTLALAGSPDQIARSDADHVAWTQVAQQTEPLCRDAADAAATAWHLGHDPHAAAADATQEWLAERGFDGATARVERDPSGTARVTATLHP